MSRPVGAREEHARIDEFIVRHWAIEPALLRGALASPVCSAEEMLGVICRVSDALRCGAPVETRFYVNGLQVPADHPLERAFLLSPSDRTLSDYIEGVAARLEGQPFYLVIDNAALLHLDVWERMRRLAEQVVRRVGYPTGRIEYNAFMGTEPFTPFGIHADRSHTLTVLVGGDGKTMLTWPPAALSPLRPGRVTKDPERMTALACQATSWSLTDPTDLLYVPPGWWHTSHKAGACRFQASLALGFALEPSPSEDLADLVARELRSAMDAELAGAGLDPARGGYPMADGALDVRAGISTQNSVALDLARQLLTPGGGAMECVEAALRLRTLRRLSGLVESTRVRDLEPLFPAPRSDGLPAAARHVRLVRPLFRDAAMGRLMAAANGLSFVTFAAADAVALVLRVLDSGEPVCLSTLPTDDPEVRRFLDFAWSSRALAVVEEERG